MRNVVTRAVIIASLVSGFAMPTVAIAQDQRYPITPCRVLDTRIGNVGFGTLAGAGEERPFIAVDLGSFGFQGGNLEGCGVPVGATAIDMNLTAVNPSGFGFLRVYPYVQGGPQVEPNATILVWYAGKSIANAMTITSCQQGGNFCFAELVMKSYGAGTDMVIEVLGYYLPAAAELDEGRDAPANTSPAPLERVLGQ